MVINGINDNNECYHLVEVLHQDVDVIQPIDCEGKWFHVGILDRWPLAEARTACAPQWSVRHCEMLSRSMPFLNCDSNSVANTTAAMSKKGPDRIQDRERTFSAGRANGSHSWSILREGWWPHGPRKSEAVDLLPAGDSRLAFMAKIMSFSFAMNYKQHDHTGSFWVRCPSS